MGNYSRDPNYRAADAFAKHHVSVRIQQAIPLLDADLNLLDDLRRMEHETLGQWFVGSGVPSGSDGFAILANPADEDDNNFAIRAGLCLVNGKLVTNDATVQYKTQPAFDIAKLPSLTTPTTPTNFIVYLDVFEREVDSQEDPTLVDERIGVETAIRMKREWAVRVARDPEDLPDFDKPPLGHAFLRLARLQRTTASSITVDMIRDLRDTQLSILRKIDVRDETTGVSLVNNARFKGMLEITSKNILALIQFIITNFNQPSLSLTAAEVLSLQAAGHVAHTAQAGLSSVNALTFANRSAIVYLHQLYTAQQNFMTIWRDFLLRLPKYATIYATFVADLERLLNEQTVGKFTGLLPALDAGNLAAAAETQEEIARLIGLAGQSIPRGTIQVSYRNAPPGNLDVGRKVRLEFRVTSFATQEDTYTVHILPERGWPRVLVDNEGRPIPGNKVSVPAEGKFTTLFVDVTVEAGSSELQLRVVSDSNPTELNKMSGLISLIEGKSAPLGEDKVELSLRSFVNAELNNVTGVVRFFKDPSKQPGRIGLILRNNSGTAQDDKISLAVEVVKKQGTWTAELLPPSSITLHDGETENLDGFKINVEDDAVSCQVRYTATLTVAGASVVNQRIIPCIAG